MPDPNSSTQDGPKAARKTDEPATATPATTPAPADTSDVGVYEPYPGAEFFHGGRHSPINAALGRRLEQEGHGDGRLLGPDWTNAHRDANRPRPVSADVAPQGRRRHVRHPRRDRLGPAEGPACQPPHPGRVGALPMAAPLTADRFVTALKAEGVRVVERSGWRSHNRNSKGAWSNLNGIVIHHTAGTNSLNLCWSGTSDLPGPLCHTHLAKDGTATMVGYGRANHAGTFATNAFNAMLNESSTHPRPDASEPTAAPTTPARSPRTRRRERPHLRHRDREPRQRTRPVPRGAVPGRGPLGRSPVPRAWLVREQRDRSQGRHPPQDRPQFRHGRLP
ncbi:hypothetical protein SUDANB145_07188 (plasmid) [Streptomyces sp. enrichment culture]